MESKNPHSAVTGGQNTDRAVQQEQTRMSEGAKQCSYHRQFGGNDGYLTENPQRSVHRLWIIISADLAP
jgi:hypothetical protein